MWNALLGDLRKKLEQWRGMFFKVTQAKKSTLYASYVVSLEFVKVKKPFSDGTVVKKCAVEMVKALDKARVGENFWPVSRSHHAVQIRVIDLGEQVIETVFGLAQNSCYVLLCLDESTD